MTTTDAGVAWWKERGVGDAVRTTEDTSSGTVANAL